MENTNYGISGMWFSGYGHVADWIKNGGAFADVTLLSERRLDGTVYYYEQHPTVEKLADFDGIKILVVRNPLNMFADRLMCARVTGYHLYKQQKSLKRIKPAIDLWKEHVKEFTSSGDITVINYDQWLQDKDYRMKLAESLDIEDTLPSDFRKEDLTASENICENHPFYLNIFDGGEMVELIKDTFGDFKISKKSKKKKKKKDYNKVESKPKVEEITPDVDLTNMSEDEVINYGGVLNLKLNKEMNKDDMIVQIGNALKSKPASIATIKPKKKCKSCAKKKEMMKEMRERENEK